MSLSRTILPALALALLSACGGGEQKPAEEPAAAPAQPAPPAPTAAAATGDTITVRMVTTQNGAAGQFEPAAVTAKPGDVLRFVSDGGAQHNVSWPADQNAGATGLPAPSAYVMTPDQPVDVPVTFGAGTYTFQCDPHAPMGMKGTLTVS